MKVLFISNIYPNKEESFRGIYIQNRAKALQKLGLNVKVAVLSTKKIETNDDFSSCFLYKENDNFLKYLNIGKKPSIDPSFKDFLKSFKPDLIIFCIVSLWLKQHLIYSYKEYKFANFFEGRNADGQFKDHKLYKFFIYKKQKRLFKKMEYLFFCSSFAYEDFIKKFPSINKNKCHVLENGFDQNVFIPSKLHPFNKQKIKIISVGNISKYKGQKLLLEAVNLLPSNLKNKLLIEIIGTGNRDEIDELHSIARHSNVDFIYKDQLDPKSLFHEYQTFDYFILPSYFESFGCVYLEAMSQGLICVGCKNQGPSLYITDSFNGFLVKENDVLDLKNLLVDVINEKKDIQTISKNAILTSKKYSWDNFATNFIKLFSSLK